MKVNSGIEIDKPEVNYASVNSEVLRHRPHEVWANSFYLLGLNRQKCNTETLPMPQIIICVNLFTINYAVH